MKLTAYLHKTLVDLLDDRHIIVWYDSDHAFSSFISLFKPPDCSVILTADSVLRARRTADELYRSLTALGLPAKPTRMLLYVNRRRGAGDDEKMHDPFEVYALAGAAFGDTEDQRLESLSRQAMPERADEISRLFREGRPTIALLDDLEEAQRYPVLKQVFRTESPAEIMAGAICDEGKAAGVGSTPGCLDEFLRLTRTNAGFSTTPSGKGWKSVRQALGRYLLFSEFVYDIGGMPPESLSAVPRADDSVKETVLAACQRMRSDTALREAYIETAFRVENELRLPELFSSNVGAGERETFPFEEKRLLQRLVDRITAGDLTTARAIVEGRRQSIWRTEAHRSLFWTAAERGLSLVETAARLAGEMHAPKTLRELIVAYTDQGWAGLDRIQRVFESSLTSCVDDEELVPLIDLCRRRYREIALQIQDRFLGFLQREGWPPEGVLRQTRIFDDYVAPVLERREKVGYFLVDSLRYEMGGALCEALKPLGEVDIVAAAGVFPTITEYGMAALMPKADGLLRMEEKDGAIAAVLGTRLVRTSAERMNVLKDAYGDRMTDVTLDELLSGFKKVSSRIKNVDLLVVRTQDPDLIGESLGGWRARRYLSDVIGDIASAVRLVSATGFKRIVISADHGHLMLPEILAGDIVSEPNGRWIGSKRRCRLGTSLAPGPGTVTMKAGSVGLNGDITDVCVPVGFRVFANGEGYFHEGMSLQECVIPLIVLRQDEAAPEQSGRPHISIHYRADRFTSRVIGLKIHYQADIFMTPARVRVEAFAGKAAKAALVGEAADCEARDDKTRDVTLQPGQETAVPLLMQPDFEGGEIEIRVSDPQTRVIWATLVLKNSMMD